MGWNKHSTVSYGLPLACKGELVFKSLVISSNQKLVNYSGDQYLKLAVVYLSAFGAKVNI